MSTGLLSPDAALREFSDLGLPLSGAKLHTYVSGTPSTPLATYSESTLVTQNANPVVASVGGLFGAIYLTPGVAYKYVLTDSSDVTIWQRDPVMAAGFDAASLTNHGVLVGTGSTTIGATSAGTAGQVLTSNGASADPTFQASGANNAICQGRLTLTTGVPVTTADVTAATTVYFAPYQGNLVGLYSGTAWVQRTFAQLSIPVPAAVSSIFDVFVYDNAGVATLELSSAWSSDTAIFGSGTYQTTRPTQDGIEVKSTNGTAIDATRRFVATIRTTTVSGQTEDSETKRYVYNRYNQVPRSLKRFETATTWNYQTATVRQANANTANQVEIVTGMAENALDLLLTISAEGATRIAAGIGEDSTTTFTAGGTVFVNSSGASITPRLVKVPTIGRHFYSWNEWSTAAGTTTWNGAVATVGSTITSGLIGWFKA